MDFKEKSVGNGAPTDAFDRFEVHGWALGALGTGGPITYYVDDVGLYGEVAPPALSVGFASANFDVAEGSTGEIVVKLNRNFFENDPDEVTVEYAVEELTPIPGREYTPVSGSLTFTRGGDQEQSFSLETFDDSKYEPDERVMLRLSNAVGGELGAAQASATIVDDDPFDPLLYDDFELYPYLWEAGESLELSNPELAPGDAMALPGQDGFERVLQVQTNAAYDGPTKAVIDDLTASITTSDKQSKKQIEDAIKRLEQSLDPDYWINRLLLDPEDGKQVFDRQAQALSELRKVVKAGGPQSPVAQSAIDQVVELAAELASFSIEIAESNGAEAKEMIKAQKRAKREAMARRKREAAERPAAESEA